MRDTTLDVGSIVKLKVNLLGNKRGSVGVCYENYKTGSSFIFENGNYDGFSIPDQNKMLRFIGTDDSITDYKFKSVITVSNDFLNGIFNFEVMKLKMHLANGI